ncbi:MAG: response regulator [Dehalococcoidia bacterium]|nr:response regulator [Dehalococcoidia bacterium]MSQ15992.1 response regulator [Dehalococcoidia bacterium]
MPRGTETVLLAEDDSAVQGMVAAMLRTQGYTVLQACNGEEALAVARSPLGQGINLLLTDVMMPRMGGMELAEQFSHLYPSAKVLFTSGYTDEPVAFHGISGDSVPFIEKPFLPSDLASKVREVLGSAPMTGH